MPADPTPEQIAVIAAWVAANGIRPKDVPLDSELATVTAADGTRTIRYTAFIRHEETDNVLADAAGRAMTAPRETPLITAESLPEWIATHTPAAT
jgi:hypothetical protein